MSEMQGLSSSVNPETDNPPSDTQANDATTSDQTMAGSASPPSDPASSLRAAALLTLKSKRRKPVTDQQANLSQRPIPTGLVLNYGEEESTPSTTAPPSAIEKTMASSTKTATSEVEDNREEGEISDTESTPPAVPKLKPSTKKASKAKATPTDKNSISKTSPTSAKPPAIVKPPTPEQKTESAPTTPVPGPSTSLTSTAQSQIPPNVVDANHVRPGLAMTEKQYEVAKDIVLDLLGWGVEPEYIADTGVSREIIFYVFTELHLRLPRNFDATGLIPYPFYPSGPEPLQVTPAVTQTRRHRSNSSTIAMPPPPSIPPRHDAPPFTPGRAAHPSLPQKPPVPQGNPTVSSVSRSNSGPPTQLSVLTNVRDIEQQRKQAGAETDLHKIEQLRKQELIARKAVQASRKNKAAAVNAAGASPPATSPPLASSEYDTDMGGVVPAESVDDFLKSIGSVSDTDNGEGTSGGTSSTKDAVPAQFRRHESPAPMDVDEIPGFFASSHKDASPSRPESAQSKDDASALRSGMVSGPSTEPPPSSTDSNSGFSEATSTEAGGSHHLKEDIPPGGQDFQQSEQGRRGIKRPVASDFVDFESAPSRPSNGYSNGGASQPPSLRRKTTGSFASVSGMRRCVIDLSDSEDDGDGDVHRMANERGQRIYSPLPTRAHTASSSMPHIPTGGDWVPPQHTASNGNSGTQSPAALFAKEEEIKKMRELIAMREQSRLKKLAAMSRPASTPVTNPPTVPQVTPPLSDLTSTVKQEEDESTTGLTPLPTTNEASHLMNDQSCNASENGKTQDVVPEPHLHHSGSVIPISELAVLTSASTSASATPPIADDPDPNALENVNTGEQVLTAEARQEQAVTSNTMQPEERAVDVNDRPSLSSTQTSQPRPHEQHRQAPEYFPTYDSPFESYPLLRSRLRRMLPDDLPTTLQDQHQQEAQPSYSASLLSSSSSLASSSSLPSSSSVVSPNFIPDLKPLRKAASFKTLDPSKQICQYELPGGGVCRDEGCQDVHLSRGLDGASLDGVEPSDEDTAEYLYDILSADHNPSRLTQERRVTVGAIQGALQGLRGIGKVYEERVAEALATLQPPPPAI